MRKQKRIYLHLHLPEGVSTGTAASCPLALLVGVLPTGRQITVNLDNLV
nr:MAG TPA: hypothetical protein [Inoviridae sp.]